MTINEINKILAQLAESPSRENVLDFAFALLQWMHIEPNVHNKPQLLSPQTQKLKDFLATAPQTVQPQLYRMSADNQNVRVRFAVLKKLKKDYISQLVDNDPGLTSYQASIKGIVHQPGKPQYIPQQPYFIHFVTTPDYDKLLLILNQGDQKRIVSFRRRLTTTQYNKILQQWQGIGSKPKPEIADLLWKSLDIKEVNKEFYKQIKERFDALLGIVKTQHTTATENQVKQFTVRLIGRYIFCWFLKEKGIIPSGLIDTDSIKNTPNFYQTVLLPLFFKTLNTKVQDREILKSVVHKNLGTDHIPYLNGGLFDESEEDKLFIDLNLDAWLLPFVEILESFDFTVDESSSQYQQVAVDPEMLGRIFENLLASQNEETEKLANQRKAFGAFYTPREIVDYMVNESIKAYLQTQWEQHIIQQKTKTLNNPEPMGDIFGNIKPQQLALEIKRYELKAEDKSKIEKAIEPLFAANPETAQLKKEEKNLLLLFLEQIKILDPACGSGAFPMGILHKLVELHETLGTVKSPYELKKDILSQNIYGVDIMPMAIEIARLRAWLSLVLEENYNPKDPVHNFGLKPLPNLDFKFVCANSLIDLGLDAFINVSKGTLHEGFTKTLVSQLKELENLRKRFFTPALGSNEKEQLKADYFTERDKVVAAIEADSDPVLKAIAQKIKHWNPFDDSQSSPFFSPTWMFGIDKGFDVVIGNPPYVNIENLSDSVKYNLYKNYSTIKGRADIYIAFIEGLIKKTSKGGALTYIIPYPYTNQNYGALSRKMLIDYYFVKEIIDTSDYYVFESAVVKNIILRVLNTKSDSETIVKKVSSEKDFISNSFTEFKLHQNEFLNLKDYRFETKDISTALSLKNKVWKKSIRLDEICLIAYGARINHKTKNIGKEHFIHSEFKKGFKPFTEGKKIDRYSFLQYGWLDYQPLQHYNSMFPELFENEKIIFINVVKDKLRFAFDNENFYNSHTVINCVKWNLLKNVEHKTVKRNLSKQKIELALTISYPFLLAILNSNLINWYFLNFLSESLHFYPGDAKELPIVKASESQQQSFISRVEKILSLKKNNQDTTSLEREIDVLVYKLYELTYEEVKIIDKDFWLSEDEYDNLKLT